MTTVSSASRFAIARHARIAGVWYLLLAIFGGFAEFGVRRRLLVPGDAAATADAIAASASLFRLGIAAELLGQIVFVLLVFALFDLLKIVHRRRAVLMVALVLLAVGLTSLNMVNQFAALWVLDGSGPLAALDVAQRTGLSALFFDLHSFGYNVVAAIFFGLWLFPLGALIYASGFIPRAIGALLVVAGAGYLLDVFLTILAPGFGVTVSEFTFIGELLLMGWLLVRGVNVDAWRERTTRTRSALG